MMTAMAASSLPSLEAEDDWGEFMDRDLAPAMICSVRVLVSPDPEEGLLSLRLPSGK